MIASVKPFHAPLRSNPPEQESDAERPEKQADHRPLEAAPSGQLFIDPPLQRSQHGQAVHEAAALLRSIAEALDAEIARWETRAKTDPEARAVLRAFLGLRELLWEFGIRREPDASESGETSKPAARKKGHSTSTRRKKPRVQRVTVEG